MNMTPNEWDEYRRPDGTIKLKNAFYARMPPGSDLTREEKAMVDDFFISVESLQRIVSRQSASLAIAMARGLVHLYRLEE